MENFTATIQIQDQSDRWFTSRIVSQVNAQTLSQILRQQQRQSETGRVRALDDNGRLLDLIQ